uniref:Uncharacterized protein n=1 Tax=Arundo donax TaxID=35708 RepID=A0A0A9ST58_ARUDO
MISAMKYSFVEADLLSVAYSPTLFSKSN